MEHRAPRPDSKTRRAAALIAGALAACGGQPGGGSGGGEESTGAIATSTTAQSASAGTSDADASTGGTESGATTGQDASTGAPAPVALCESIAISLVLDPAAPVYGEAAIPVFGEFLDDIVEQTGAEIRLRLAIGTDLPLVHFCLTPGPDAVDGLDLVWGRDFTSFPEARDALRCYLDVAQAAPSGDGMFAGMLGPIVAGEFPPPDTDLAAAMLIARTDDGVNDAASRPGLATEAFLRLAIDGDRRRTTAFAWGRLADELETFTISVGDTSGYYDRGTWSLAAALSDWRPALVTACQEHDISPPPVMPGGCEHIDILFVVDGSFSMAEEQAALRGTAGNPPVFAEFTDALVDSLDTLVDFHVGVISSQPGDVVLHKHTNQPEQLPIPINECGLGPTANWIVGPNADLAEQFACIAATLANTEETTAENAAAALHHAGNAGFLREDSVLFIVMLTDEDTQGFDTPRADVHRQILDAVGGDRARVIVLSIAGDPGVFEAPKTVCQGPYGGASPGRRLTSIVRTFRDRGITQDICGGELATVFDDVLDDVIDTCMNFHPEG